MMHTEMIAAVLHTLLALVALWILIFYCWRPYRLDSLRDKLFELRYELFAIAEKGEISFNHPGYRLLHTHLNRMLGRAHRLTGLMLLLRAPEQIDNPRLRWLESLETLPSGTQKKLMDIEHRMGFAVIRHVIIGSPITIFILLSGIIGMLIRKKGGPSLPPHQVIANEVTRSIEVLDRIPEDEDALMAV
ncbi:MAG TPA: hypothetical protein VN939_05455 [Chthoniobacterales bacterium]|jgi:hypothetical protein|nr:hypothetical protein [Chthoniobacterales bacterium]